VARPPIFDRDEKVFGYELLFRDGMENMFQGGDADVAWRSTLDSSLLVDIDVLCDGRSVFLNCTHNRLIGAWAGCCLRTPPWLRFCKPIWSMPK
jgi:EAL and modified HD-GYP domain-containing signal transduction protein